MDLALACKYGCIGRKGVFWEYSLGLSGRGNFDLALVRLNSWETEGALAQLHDRVTGFQEKIND